jgi:hypothetical protein
MPDIVAAAAPLRIWFSGDHPVGYRAIITTLSYKITTEGIEGVFFGDRRALHRGRRKGLT